MQLAILLAHIYKFSDVVLVDFRKFLIKRVAQGSYRFNYKTENTGNQRV